MPELRPAEKKRVATPAVIRQPGRQVGSGALTWAKGPAQRLGREHLGGHTCLGPPRANNTSNGLTTETSAQLLGLGEPFHRGNSRCLRSVFGEVNDFNLIGFVFRVTRFE